MDGDREVLRMSGHLWRQEQQKNEKGQGNPLRLLKG
jgi:hypothetical protein